MLTWFKFVLVCLIWGLTWVALKIGVREIPPILFAASRFSAAGAMLLLFRAQHARVKGKIGWLVVASTLMMFLCYAPLFWGIQLVSSGLAAVINLACLPIMIAIFSALLGEARLTINIIAALGLGLLGLGLLFQPGLSSGSMLEIAGMGAIAAGTIAYALGSVLSRQHLEDLDPIALSGLIMLIGGVELALASLIWEPVNAGTLAHFFSPSVFGAWLFLTLAGSVVAFTLFMDLLKRWGAVRTSFFSFLSPIVAVIAGAIILDERINAGEWLGVLLLLAATLIALAAPRPDPIDGRRLGLRRTPAN